MKITKNRIYYAAVFTLATLLFRFGLSYSIESKNYFGIWLAPVFYFCTLYGFGWFFGVKDNAEWPLFDVGFRFHVTGYLLYMMITGLWYVCGFQSRYESVRSFCYTALIWGVLLLCHYLIYLKLKQRAIKGLDKTQIFE